MKSVRAFVAVLIDEVLVKRIAEVQDQAKKLAPDVKWVAPSNFHLTLKFLGNVPEDGSPEICSAVEDAVKPFSQFELSVSGLGAFPNAKRARVVWVGVDSGLAQLSEVAASIDLSLAGLGFEKEAKPFKGHVTIGRVKNSRHLDKLAQGMDEIPAEDLGILRVDSVCLMQSELHPDGPVYSPICVAKLG